MLANVSPIPTESIPPKRGNGTFEKLSEGYNHRGIVCPINKQIGVNAKIPQSLTS